MNAFRLVRTLAAAAALGAAALAAPSAALAQGTQPIRIVVGFPPGGASDGVARLMADRLKDTLKTPVIVENKPGIGGRLAAEAVKNAPPDGRTYMLGPNATLVFQHLLYPVSTLRYDATVDLRGVAQVSSFPLGMVVSANTGARNAKEYVAWLRANPGKGQFGTAGLGGETHFNGLQFGKAAGVELNVVPYKGNGPLVIDLVGGVLPAGIMVAGDALQHVKSGKLNAIGVFSAQRSPLLPDVPTMAEQGFDTGGRNGWFGVWTHAKAPKEEVDRVQAAIRDWLAQPETAAQLLERFTHSADFRTGADVDRTLRDELAHWGAVVKASGFTPQP